MLLRIDTFTADYIYQPPLLLEMLTPAPPCAAPIHATNGDKKYELKGLPTRGKHFTRTRNDAIISHYLID